MSTEVVVATAAEAAQIEHGAAIVLDPLREFLDASGLGAGEITAKEIGEGHSNLTFLIERGAERFVLRRPPRGALSASANNVLRESRVLAALASTPVPVPEVLARCEGQEVVGAPFFIMSLIEGETVNDRLPDGFDEVRAPRRIGEVAAHTLADLHAVDLNASGLNAFGKATGYLERQLRTFSILLDKNATRPWPDLELVGDWLAEWMPATAQATFVHGDYRLGNLLFRRPPGLAAVLDWEMATVGDPLADLGYFTVTWAEPDDAENPMLALSKATKNPAFPRREELVQIYRGSHSRDVGALPWYQVLALWKSAIFLEGSNRRYQEGASVDPFFAGLDHGIEALALAARNRIERFEWSGANPAEPR